MPIRERVELDDDDLDLFAYLDAELHRSMSTPNLEAWLNLERAAAVSIWRPSAALRETGTLPIVRCIVEPEELGL